MNRINLTVLALAAGAFFSAAGQSILPPVINWNGKSEALIAKPGDPWITPTETAGFITTPTYDETKVWFRKLDEKSPLITMVTIGVSPEGREIFMIIASSEKTVSADAFRKSTKPVMLVQAGIHAGEIDGKDAGMMLLRDIAFGGKRNLLDKVNLLFIPILNVDGHERSSSFNRPNQRGPQNMGWRTNAENLNLNRDFTKQDTKEVRAVVDVMNQYDPLLYMDLHVTDGADYQYDITFGGHGNQGHSKGIAAWLGSKFKPAADKDLSDNGHIPGQLIFAVNDRDFSQGNVLLLGEPRFSDSYGDVRHMASVLVENHSLKPFRQRVLGTYILVESAMKILGSEATALREITRADRASRDEKVNMKWKVPQMENTATFETQSSLQTSTNAVAADSLTFLAIDSKIIKSTVTNSEYVEWSGKPVTIRIVNYKGTEATDWVTRPKAYWIPSSCYEIIERLKRHGIKMEITRVPRDVAVEMYRIQDAKFQNAQEKAWPFEGHVQVVGTPVAEKRNQLFPAGSAIVSTDQALGDLAMMLLEPSSGDSYFSWGFFPQIFQRTEYIEQYVMEPTIKKMLEDSPDLKKEFEQKKTADEKFAKNPYAIFAWFYSKTKYYDERYLLYPIARE